jgi:hypothetical protein
MPFAAGRPDTSCRSRKTRARARGHTPRETTFSFTPHQWGSFAWRCLICPTDMHGRPHSMDGILYLIVNPTALP